MIASRRRRLRLAARDLSALFAFAPIGLSGAAPPWASVLVLLAVLLSLLGIRPLSGRGVLSAVILLGAAVILFGAVFRGGLDLVVAAVTFASLVTSQRLITESTPSTDHQALLTALLMLAGGAAISGELFYGIAAVLFTASASTTLGLLVLEGGELAEADVPLTPVVRRLWGSTAVALVGAIAFFIFFPRLSWNVAARRAAPGLGGTTGMSDRVRLGGGGDIKTSTRAVLRATLVPDPGTERLDTYWVGRAFDTFDGREWRGRNDAQAPQGRVLVNTRLRAKVQQQIDLLPAYDSTTLVALSQPVSFNSAQVIGAGGAQRVALVEVTDEEVRVAQTGNAYSYTAWSADPEASETDPEPIDEARYTQLPPTLSPRVRDLARTLLAGERDPVRAAERLERELKRRYAYTLELPGEVPDPLVDFLFERKAGHCEHFATALAVLLRAEGIPARVVAGFYGGVRAGERYVVRGGDAHAWVQVHVAGRGWRTFDATPDSGRSVGASQALQWIAARYEELEALWRARVVDYSLQDQVDLARALVRPPKEAGGPGLRLPDRKAVAWALGAALLTFLLARRLGRRTAPAHPMASFLDRLEAQLRKVGVIQLEDEPIEALSSRLARARHPLAPAVASATRAYLAARFGGRPLTPAQQSALLAPLVRKDSPVRAPASR